MIEVSNFNVLYTNVILTYRQKIFEVLWLLLWLQVAESWSTLTVNFEVFLGQKKRIYLKLLCITLVAIP